MSKAELPTIDHIVDAALASNEVPEGVDPALVVVAYAPHRQLRKALLRLDLEDIKTGFSATQAAGTAPPEV